MSDSATRPLRSPGQSPGGEASKRRLAAARAGDRAEFGRLAEPFRRELTTHCYRMLGSLQDAEDLVQETYLRAWRRLETYEGRASFRAWLYKIATNACLDELARRPKRTLPTAMSPPADPRQPMLPPVEEPIWLEPFPDEWLAPADVGPEAQFTARESISLAFLIALQRLPPRQRAVLILRDVLEWRAREVANLLETTVSAVYSLRHRARSSLDSHYVSRSHHDLRPDRLDDETSRLLGRYMRAWEEADIETIVSLLKEEATFPMPPSPSWFRGRADIRAFIADAILAGDAAGRWRLLPLWANAQPGFAWYLWDESRRLYEPYAIQVLTLDGNMLADVTTFGLPALFPSFGLPAVIGKRDAGGAEAIRDRPSS